jgi:hypothetical protein
MNELACPSCFVTTGLWEVIEVPGWRSVSGCVREGERVIAARDDGYSERETDWRDATSSGMGGCAECSWEGRLKDLVQLDGDGEPVKAALPGQEALAL